MPALATRHARDYKHDLDISGFSFDEIYLIDENEDNLVNSVQNFEISTEIASSDFRINYNEALKRLKELQSNVDKNFEDDLLNW